jgi:hypothetical protein
MSADLYYMSWRDKKERLIDPDCTDFVESLHVEFFAGSDVIGIMRDETCNGAAAIRLFELDGKIVCTVDDGGNDQLIVFDGLDFETLERAWDSLAKAYDSEIYGLRQKCRTDSEPVDFQVKFY